MAKAKTTGSEKLVTIWRCPRCGEPEDGSSLHVAEDCVKKLKAELARSKQDAGHFEQMFKETLDAENRALSRAIELKSHLLQMTDERDRWVAAHRKQREEREEARTAAREYLEQVLVYTPGTRREDEGKYPWLGEKR